MPVSNQFIAEVLLEISEYLAMQDVPFRPRAYEKASLAVSNLEVEVSDMYKTGGLKALEEVHGVGASIAEKIEELLKTGRSSYHLELKKKTPVDLPGLRAIEGLGPKSIKKLYEELKIKNIADLEKAARAGRIGSLAGFGKKSEENILKGIEFLKKSGGRAIIGFAMPELRGIEARLRNLPGVERAVIAGSVRRRKETIGDADILVVSRKPEAVMDFFVRMPEVVRVYAHGSTKSAIKIKSGLDVDVRVVPEESYGAALNYFTGSKDHNVALRQIAIKKGYKLNEYGLFNGHGSRIKGREGKMVAGKTEEELYTALGMEYIEPELRENRGELKAALRPIRLTQGRPEEIEGRQAQGKPSKLPRLIGYDELQGDLQVQTEWTDGAESIEAMARAAMQRGLRYIAITDHTKRLAMTKGLDERRVAQQGKEIDRVNLKLKAEKLKMTILKGTECDILKDGTLDLEDSALAKLDMVGVSVHSYFNLPREEQTKRIVRAMRNPHVDIVFHPTGRVINKRAAYDVDMDELVRAAKETGTVMEVDAYPDRLDLKDDHIRKCVDAGVRLSIDSDAHASAQYDFLEYGIAQARRGWAERKDVINAWPLEKMLGFLKKP